MKNGSRLVASFERPSSTNVCVEDARGRHTYGEVREGARRVASALLGEAQSLAAERIAILVSPGAAFVEAFFGVLQAGGCVVVLSPIHPASETAYFCGDAEVHTVVASRDLASRLDGLGERRVLVLEDLPAPPEPRTMPGALAGDAALQLYTSGTTGKPKGAVITHENLTVQQELLAAAWEFHADDVLLHALPLHHMHGLAIALLTALGIGATTRMLPAFDARRLWDEMGTSTVLMAVPTMYARLLAAFDEADPPTRARWTSSARGLRLATSGSAALPTTLAERWRVIAGDIPVERFGMTEIGVGMTNPLKGPRKPGSVGLPLPGVETRIVDGELQVRGPSVFAGYFKREDATREAFVDGWFRTGDTVARADDGYFKILGRTSVDILKSGGYKLSALEIEEVLREHPAVLEVAVVGVPDETWGDRVVACVVPRAGMEGACTTEVLRAFAKETLAPYKVPREVICMPDLPRNAVGKVLKPQLLRLLAARASGNP
jgi:malonyl-CoA/methylmalonyl-CoA synthetase